MNYLNDDNRRIYDLAEIQGDIFEGSISKKMPSYYFIRSFMNSRFAISLDKKWIDDSSLDKEGILMEIKNKVKQKRGTFYSQDEMHWIGYIYRIMAHSYNISSSAVFKLVKPDYLRKVFPLYHSLDSQKVTKLIKEDLNIKILNKEEKIRLILKAQ